MSTTNNPVDVLAVIRDACNDKGDWMPKLVKAHDAVAELMEAAVSYKRARGVKPQHVVNAKFARLDAALARCGAADPGNMNSLAGSPGWRARVGAMK